MARAPFAVWKPLDPELHSEPVITPRVVVLHSAVDSPGPTSLHPYFDRDDVYVESHFFVKLDGTVEQYQDTDRQADAQYQANDFAISIETEDEGDPNNRPWNEAQLDAIEHIIRWCNAVHGIPLKKVQKWDGSGIGYHSMWGAPSEWTPVSGKTCPGYVRIDQFNDVLIPRLHETPTASPILTTDPDMDLTRNVPVETDASGKGHNYTGFNVSQHEVKSVEPHVVFPPDAGRYWESGEVGWATDETYGGIHVVVTGGEPNVTVGIQVTVAEI